MTVNTLNAACIEPTSLMVPTAYISVPTTLAFASPPISGVGKPAGTKDAKLKRPIKTMRETFALDEGEVSLSYPAELSPESYQDMADRIEILLRGLKRRTDAEATRRRTERDDVPN